MSIHDFIHGLGTFCTDGHIVFTEITTMIIMISDDGVSIKKSVKIALNEQTEAETGGGGKQKPIGADAVRILNIHISFVWGKYMHLLPIS